MTTLNSHSPEIADVQASMCHAAQPIVPQAVARWIVEEGQLLGVLVASCPSPLFQEISTGG